MACLRCLVRDSGVDERADTVSSQDQGSKHRKVDSVVIGTNTVPSVILNASNLENGGGVQVAASLIDELRAAQHDEDLLERFAWLSDVTIQATPQVCENLTSKSSTSEVHITRRKWWMPAIWLPKRPRYDLEFTVFGPRYGARRASITLTGIADGTSVYPQPEGIPRAKRFGRAVREVRGFVSRRIFRRETHLVAEGASILDAYIDRTKFAKERTSVIPNVVNSAVLDEALRKPLGFDVRSFVADGTLLLAYVARMYPHKNHPLLPKVHQELALRGIDAKFVVTLSDSEWGGTSEEFRKACINLGVIEVNQLADVYSQCDAGIFPSLLESFSATPLEILATNGVLFASDRGFVKDVCGDAAVYFDPLSAIDCADVIADLVGDSDRLTAMKEKASRFSASHPTSAERMLAYFKLIDALLLDA